MVDQNLTQRTLIFPKYVIIDKFKITHMDSEFIFVFIKQPSNDSFYFKAQIKNLKFVRIFKNIEYSESYLFSNIICPHLFHLDFFNYIILANLKNSLNTLSSSTEISFDGGITWNRIHLETTLPEYNYQPCKFPQCYAILDLSCSNFKYSTFHKHKYNQNPNVIVVRGDLILSNNRYPVTFISNNYGKNWNVLKRGHHLVSTFNHGSGIILADPIKCRGDISHDHGKTFETIEFNSRSNTKLLYYYIC